MRKTIPYRWACHGCQQGNEPGTSVCAHCGTPALAGIERIERAARHAYIEDSSATAPPVAPEWPLHIRVLNGAAIISGGLTILALQALDFDWRYLGGFVLMLGFFGLGAYALHRESRARVLREVAARDAEEEAALARGEAPPVQPELPDVPAKPPTPLADKVLGAVCAITGLAALLLFEIGDSAWTFTGAVFCAVACWITNGVLTEGKPETNKPGAEPSK